MRDIKFRVWEKPNTMYLGEMRYIDLYWFEEEGIREVGDRRDYYELMQFTGLKDKNSKEIYECDVLGLDDPTDKSKCIVEFVEAAFRLNIMGSGVYYLDWSDWIVIGNIYENPKLLKGE